MFYETEYLIILASILVCIVGCIWSHTPFKKSLLITLLAPVIVFGSFFAFAAASMFFTAILFFIIEKAGYDLEKYITPVAKIIAGLVVITLTGIYFSNERGMNRADKRYK